jgi:3-hydroxybutyryl-CoA dehydrogenase
MRTVGVVGGSLMGSGIADVAARSGCTVAVVESDPDRTRMGRDRIAASLDKAAQRGKITDTGEIAARITVSTELHALASCDLSVEAIAEDESAKITLFQELDRGRGRSIGRGHQVA